MVQSESTKTQVVLTWVKGLERSTAAHCAGALRPGAASHLGETPFLEGFLQVGMLIPT